LKVFNSTVLRRRHSGMRNKQDATVSGYCKQHVYCENACQVNAQNQILRSINRQFHIHTPLNALKPPSTGSKAPVMKIILQIKYAIFISENFIGFFIL
jgi:hypothetical protein